MKRGTLFVGCVLGLSSLNALSKCNDITDDGLVYIPEYMDYLPYETRGNSAIFEGDIVVDSYCSKKNSTDSNTDGGLSPYSVIINQNSGRRWPNNVVPYKFSSDYADSRTEQDLKHQFILAIEHLHATTPIRFVERTTQVDYINVRNNFSARCESSIGRIGGAQTLYFSNGCGGTPTAIHELLHALGFWHEQSHPRRDEYVEVLWDNIQPHLKGNFEIRAAADVMEANSTYDYKSIMHYGEAQMSIDGSPTLRSLTSQTIAPSATPTALDNQSLKRAYPAKTVIAQLTPTYSNVFMGTNIRFSALASYDASPTPGSLTYSWTIPTGDSKIITSLQPEASATFGVVGRHQSTLKVSNGQTTDTIKTTVDVWGAEMMPIINSLTTLL